MKQFFSRLLIITLVIGTSACSPDNEIASETIAIKVNKLEWGTTQLSGEFNPMPESSEMTTSKLWETTTFDDHTFNHFASIYEYDGKIFTMWMTHSADEHGPGQAIRYRVSNDFGITWTPVNYLFDPMDDIQLKRADKYSRYLNPVGFCELSDGFYVVAEAMDHPNLDVAPVGVIARRINNDGSLDAPFWIYRNDGLEMAPDPIVGYPAFTFDNSKLNEFINWFKIHRPASHGASGIVFESRLRVEEGIYVYHINGNFTEQSQTQLPDGGYIRIWRGFYSPYTQLRIYAQYSEDGITYPSPPGASSIPSTRSKAVIKNIDGVIILMGNPISTDGRVGRDPLIMAMTDATLRFNPENIYNLRSGGLENRFNGALKNGAFSYPDFLKMSNGKIGLVYSTYGKENIEFSTFNLPELQ